MSVRKFEERSQDLGEERSRILEGLELVVQQAEVSWNDIFHTTIKEGIIQLVNSRVETITEHETYMEHALEQAKALEQVFANILQQVSNALQEEEIPHDKPTLYQTEEDFVSGEISLT